MRNPIGFALLLIASIGLNIFLGSVLLTSHWHRKPPPPLEHLNTNAFTLSPPEWFALMKQFPELRAHIRPILKQEAPAVRQRIEEMHHAHATLRQIMNQEPFDPTAATQAFNTLLNLEITLKQTAIQTSITILKSLTPEQRQWVMQQRPPHFPRGDRHRRHEPFKSDESSPRAEFENPENWLAKLKQRDSNQDGQITYEEFIQPLPPHEQNRAEMRFMLLDDNDDGIINRDELTKLENKILEKQPIQENKP